MNRKLTYLLMAAMMIVAAGISSTACSPDDIVDILDDDIQTDDGKNDPKNDKNTVTITPDGAKVTCGDISINFPKGTFDKDAKVTVTNVGKGKILGDDEVSKFYKLTMPAATGKSLKVRIKSDQQGEDINVVAHAPCYHISEDEIAYNDNILESTYADGEYVATIPKTGNAGEEEGTVEINIGLARMYYCGKGSMNKARETRAPMYNEKFTEGDVSWHFNFSPYQKTLYAESLFLHWDEINNTIREAIKILHGFKLKVTKRDIAMSFVKMDDLKDEDGLFAQSQICNEWSTVEFSVKILSDFEGKRDKFRRAVIHELMHDYQADYDNRSAYRKAKALLGGWDTIYSITYESGAVWAEQFMGGSFSMTFVSGYLDDYRKGYQDIDIIYKDSKLHTTTAGRYAAHGYAFSTVIEYMTKKMKDRGLNDNSILDLYKIWYDTKSYAKECVDQLTRSKGHGLFALDNYDEYLLCMLKGDLISGWTVDNCELTSGGKITDKNHSIEASGSCFVYGTHILYYTFNVTDDIPMANKELVIEQLEDGVQTYCLAMKTKVEQLGYKAWKGSPLVIDGAELKDAYYAKDSKRTAFKFYTITTTEYNKETKPLKLKIYLRDKGDASVTPNKLSFTAKGGTQSVTVKSTGYKYYGYSFNKEYLSWLSAKLGSGNTVQITAQPNESGTPRTATVNCYVTNEEKPTDAQKVFLPVSIIQDANTSGGETDVHITKVTYLSFLAKLKAKTSTTNDVIPFSAALLAQTMQFSQSGSTLHVTGSQTDYDRKHTISFDIINLTTDYAKTVVKNLKYTMTDKSTETVIVLNDIPNSLHNQDFGSYLYFGGTVSKGMKVSSFYSSYSGTVNYSYVDDPDNSSTLQLHVEWTRVGARQKLPIVPWGTVEEQWPMEQIHTP